jgi:hypothetical protein
MIIFEKDSKELSLNDLNNGKSSQQYPQISWVLYADGFIAEEVDFPEDDYYRFDIFARGTQALGEWVRLAFKINDQLVLPRIVEGEDTLKYTFVEKIAAGKHKVSFHFEYDRQVDEVQLQTGRTQITPMTNTYISGGNELYTGRLTITKLSSGIVRTVPSSEYPTIQSAIDASAPGDKVIVAPGTYNEQLVMREGVILVSDNSNGGDDPTDIVVDDDLPVANQIQKKALKRTLRTIIDGTGFPDYTDAVPMVDFPEGLTEVTILDGFSITNMPQVNHTLPGHAHTVQCRGSSPTVLNNFVYNNGSSGIGSHATFQDENLPISKRDFTYDNVKYHAHPIIKNNIFFHNSGAGIGNNHYSYAIVFDNECVGNYAIADHDAPGIGIQHGAHPIVEANVAHHNDWSGICGRKGDNQGKPGRHINRPVHPTIRKNVCYRNGLSIDEGDRNIDQGAGIGGDSVGDEDYRMVVEQNICYKNQMAGIGIRNDAQVIIRNNKSYKNKLSGIGINNCSAFVLVKENIVDKNESSGIGCVNGSAPVIFNNMVYANLFSGIGLDGAGKAKLIFNQMYENKMAGIGIKNKSDAEFIKGNRIYENETVGVGIKEKSKLVGIYDNKIFNNKRPGIALLSGAVVEEIGNNAINNNGLLGSPNVVIKKCSKVGETTRLISNTITGNAVANISIDSSHVELEKNVIANCKNAGVAITGNSKVRANRNLIYQNDGAGIMAQDSKLESYHNTLNNNAYRRAGAIVGFNAEILLKNSILSKSKIGIGGNPKSITTDYNCFWESFVPPMYNTGSHNIKQDPEFVDEGGNDYRLTSDSPCIDEGKKISGINDDYLGDGPDIGAFEWDGTT